MAKPDKEKGEKATRMSDAAVQAKTGKNWQQWFAILDAAGAKKMNHKAIVAYLSEHPGVAPWWRQMVTATYEQERGMREKHQTPKGYEISVSRTMTVSVGTLYKAWQDERIRRRWLPDSPIVIRKATVDKSMRITWTDRRTSVEVNFYPKGSTKCQVTVQHSKLPDAKAAARMKTYWANTIDRLREMLGA